MNNEVARINDDWNLSADIMRSRNGADVAQWVLQRRNGAGDWRIAEFVLTSKAYLERRMAQKGVLVDNARRLLDSLPDTVEQWRQEQRVRQLEYSPGDKPARIAWAAVSPPIAPIEAGHSAFLLPRVALNLFA